MMRSESNFHSLKLDNPFSGRVAKQFDAPFSHQRELSY
jgi:hypothetical protein